jgi:hypothetical protein
LIDVVVALGLLGGLQALQLALVTSGEVTVHGSGFLVLMFLYFPTILTTYVVLALGQRRGMRFRNLGFVRPQSWRPALHAFTVALAAGPAYTAALFVVGALSAPFGPAFIIGALAPGGLPVTAVASWAVPIVTTVPLLEEIIFRGLLFRGLRTRFALVPALVITGLLFAAFHMDIVRLVPLAIAGAAFAYAYERSGSIWPAIAAHAGLNGVWVAVILLRPFVHA